MTYLDVEEVFGEHGRAVVDGDTGTVEHAAEHLSADWHSEHITGELAMRVHVIDLRRALENL